MRRTPNRAITAIVGSISLIAGLAACGSSGTGSSGSSGTGSSGSSGSAPGDACSAYKQYGTFNNKTVSMYSAIVAPEDQPYLDSFKQFESCTGIKIEFQGDTNFDSQVQVRIKGGNPPDLAVFAQPGLIKQLATSGNAVEAPVAVQNNVKKFWSTSWQNYVSANGKIYGVPLDANVKSFVWYSPKAFAKDGYQIPNTLDQLKALSDKIAATGKKPWCAGISAGDATGWPVTDWMSEMMLRRYGGDTYDKWVNHKIPFNGPEATAALDAVGQYLKNPAYVNGGFGDVKSIATTTWQDAGLAIVRQQCSMYKQGSFYAQDWPKGTHVSPNGDAFAFYFPGKDASSKPVTGGGSFLVAFSNRPEVKAVQTFISSAAWVNTKVAATPGGGWVSANTGLDVTKLTNPIDKLSAQILVDPKTVFRFTGSDLMPPAVGTNSFWKGATEWITGKSTKDTLDMIEKSWPTS